jgi:hypothetical protein
VADLIFWRISRFGCWGNELIVDEVDGDGEGDGWEVGATEVEEVV